MLGNLIFFCVGFYIEAKYHPIGNFLGWFFK